MPSSKPSPSHAPFQPLPSLSSRRSQQVIEAALSASRQLPTTSEEETRANNVTCAEVFAGLLRGITTQLHHQLRETQSSSSATTTSEAQIKATLANVEQVGTCIYVCVCLFVGVCIYI